MSTTTDTLGLKAEFDQAIEQPIAMGRCRQDARSEKAQGIVVGEMGAPGQVHLGLRLRIASLVREPGEALRVQRIGEC